MQLTVLTDRSQGGSSLRDGALELMVRAGAVQPRPLPLDPVLAPRGPWGRFLPRRPTPTTHLWSPLS